MTLAVIALAYWIACGAVLSAVFIFAAGWTNHPLVWAGNIFLLPATLLLLILHVLPTKEAIYFRFGRKETIRFSSYAYAISQLPIVIHWIVTPAIRSFGFDNLATQIEWARFAIPFVVYILAAMPIIWMAIQESLRRHMDAAMP